MSAEQQAQASRFPAATAADHGLATVQAVGPDSTSELVLEFIRSRRLSGLFVQIGAGDGSLTRRLAGECGAERLLAVEASESGIRALNSALASDPPPGRAVWSLCACASSLGTAFLNPHEADTENRRVFVSAVRISPQSTPATPVTIDALCRGLSGLSLLMINVDTHELEAIASARDTLSSRRPELCLDTTSETHPEIVRDLKGAGYLLIRSFKNGSRYFVFAGRFPLLLIAAFRRLPTPLARPLIDMARSWLLWQSRRRLSQTSTTPDTLPVGARRLC